VTSYSPAVIAVDGGNSKTDLALVAGDGTLLALARGPGVPGRLSPRTVEVIAGLLATAVDGQPGTAVAGHLVACVANADLPQEEQELEQMLSSRGWTQSTLVANDTFAVLRAGLDDELPPGGPSTHWGIGVTCGAGINCVGLAPDGRSYRFLALGHITGDWGGGLGIGFEAQYAAIRAADGRGGQTVLRELVPGHFGMTEPSEVAVAIHLGQLSFSELAGLTRVVFAAADSGDQVATDIVFRQAEEIFLMVRSAARQLGLRGIVPVVLGGGVLAAGNALLTDRIASLVLAELPDAAIRVVREAPVAGAALLGLDMAGAPAEAKRRVRGAFAAMSATGQAEPPQPAG
jgi:N-acetylglucosamine kinase-like BadF-type ATPase